jgi:hypothetical protein
VTRNFPRRLQRLEMRAAQLLLVCHFDHEGTSVAETRERQMMGQRRNVNHNPYSAIGATRRVDDACARAQNMADRHYRFRRQQPRRADHRMAALTNSTPAAICQPIVARRCERMTTSRRLADLSSTRGPGSTYKAISGQRGRRCRRGVVDDNAKHLADALPRSTLRVALSALKLSSSCVSRRHRNASKSASRHSQVERLQRRLVFPFFSSKFCRVFQSTTRKHAGCPQFC